MPKREPLSVAVITLNEERNLGRCLGSVHWAEEIVVVDAGSTDRTLEVAARFGAKIVSHPWPGYVAQKNLAVESTSHPWVLSLDADEWLSEEGAGEVRQVLEQPKADAYAFNRLSAFAGSFLYRTWSPDWQVRLFRKDRGRFAGGQVHERAKMDRSCRIQRLEKRLMHLTYRSLHEYVTRMNRYSDLGAATLRDRGKKPSLSKLLFSPPVTFLKLYVLKGGFLDGMRGLVVSAGSAYSTFLKYAKLWELEHPPDPTFTAMVPPTPEDHVHGAEMGGEEPSRTQSG